MLSEFVGALDDGNLVVCDSASASGAATAEMMASSAYQETINWSK
jgi:hypothetical protein